MLAQTRAKRYKIPDKVSIFYSVKIKQHVHDLMIKHLSANLTQTKTQDYANNLIRQTSKK